MNQTLQTEPALNFSLLTASDIRIRNHELASVLIDCVAGGASVGFTLPLSETKARVFWQDVAESVALGSRTVIVAEQDGRIVGAVQIILTNPDNQPHRAEIAKMLVHRDARQRGLGQRLLEEAETAAAAAGKTLLILDTASGSASERLYLRCGWTKVGEIPNYAVYPDGKTGNSSIFYKTIGNGDNAYGESSDNKR